MGESETSGVRTVIRISGASAEQYELNPGKPSSALNNVLLKVKVKVNVDLFICIGLAPRREHTSKALRYGTRSQGISQFYLHTPRSSANGMNHTCLFLPSRSCYSFTDPGRMEG